MIVGDNVTLIIIDLIETSELLQCDISLNDSKCLC
jgi:hypothetical protein